MIWGLPTRLREHPLLYDWNADGQKLYGWLRRRVCRGEADCPREAREYHAQGFPDRLRDGGPADGLRPYP